MRVVCIMMQKNEVDLLPLWAEHHGRLFGFENLIVFDNSSDDPRIPEILRDLASKGVNIDLTRQARDDFLHKGRLFASVIKSMDEQSAADFYIPLDCDEFVGVELSEGNLSFEISQIERLLKPLIGSPDVLMIACSFDNHPKRPGWYVRVPEQRKCFFAEGSCENLDRGFHEGVARKSEKSVRTPLAYVHFHYKPLDLLKKHSRQKLEGQVKDFSSETLEKYRDDGMPGFHLVDHLLLENNEDYWAQFPIDRYKQIPEVVERFLVLGLAPPFTYQQKSIAKESFRAPNQLHLRMSKIEETLFRQSIEEIDIYIEFGAGGSTRTAFECGVWHVSSVETDLEYIKALLRENDLASYAAANRLKMIHADIGPTKEWGFPVEPVGPKRVTRYTHHVWEMLPEEPQVILVDGRYRVATALGSILFIRGAPLVLVHDFARVRYHSLLGYFDVEKQAEELVALRRKPGLDLIEVRKLREAAALDFW